MSEKVQSFRRLGVEFVVIILGVLIALAVDRCAQGVDEVALERTYLEALLADFQGGAESSEYAAGFIRERMTLIESLIDVVETGTVPESMTAADLATAIELAGWHPGVSFTRVTWDDLINTGRLASITNTELRRAIADFYVQLDWSRELDANWKVWMQPVQREAGYVLSPEQRLVITRNRIGGGPALTDAPPMSELVSGLRARPETLRNLGQALIVAQLAGGTVQGTAARAREIASHIETELAR